MTRQPVRLLLLLSPLLLVPQDAWAWGVGMHLQVGSWLLDQLALLPAHLQTLLAAWPRDYLYGCISADITIGKKYTHHLRHCHSWRVGRQVLAAAGDDAQRACAYGYLSHLAADSVAHGYYVPFKMMRCYNTALLQHAYWEMRFEADVDSQAWATARELATYDFSANDRMLRSVIADTIFSFGVNKRIFDSMLLVNRLKRWQQALASLERSSRWPLHDSDRQEYYALACSATLELLQDEDGSSWLKADPTGERALSAAAKIRRNLHVLWLDGKLSDAEAGRVLQELRQTLRDGILDPDRLLRLTVS